MSSLKKENLTISSRATSFPKQRDKAFSAYPLNKWNRYSSFTFRLLPERRKSEIQTKEKIRSLRRITGQFYKVYNLLDVYSFPKKTSGTFPIMSSSVLSSNKRRPKEKCIGILKKNLLIKSFYDNHEKAVSIIHSNFSIGILQ